MSTRTDQHHFGGRAAWPQSGHDFLPVGGLLRKLGKISDGLNFKPAFRTLTNAKGLSDRLGNALVYRIARGLVAVIQALPLRQVARLGRAGGGAAYYLAARHRRVAVDNLTRAFPEKAAAEIRQIVHEHFRRLGENYVSAIKTAAMSPEQLGPHLEIFGAENIRRLQPGPGVKNRVVAIGHFGNFELYASVGQFVPGFKFATTFRGLNQPGLNRVMMELRHRSGCRFFERRTDSRALLAAMRNRGLLLGLLADQHAGASGLRLPFFGRDCHTSPAPAVIALRYHCPLNTAICYRIGLARWRIQVGEEIPVRVGGRPRRAADIMTDINRVFESAIRRDPANWFWVHRRWKSAGPGLERRVAV